ncbi:TRAP transporter substrate-binding protein DctP [Reyranella sp.]|uniref:TRAP transporter substrate-binding protein DctP n=1 Tax=Reyranella sp. TaxID=1929291 RepID=UPI003BA9BB62
MQRRTLLGGVAASVLAAPALVRAADPLKMRLSLDTSATHTRTLQMTQFAKELEKVASGKIVVEVFHSAQLFRDRDVGKALRQGGAEMGVPGPWNLTGIEANLDITQTPAFYGRSAAEVYKVIDGDVGKTLNAMLGKKLGIHVLGKWLDLGASHTFSTAKPLNGPDDLKGLKIRTSGGAGQMVRVKFFDAVPNYTAWPDVPLALSQGTFDALFTTNESVKSAKLWESGVKYGLQDQQFFAQYIPMVSESFWKKLGPDLQKIVTDMWASKIDGWRKDMAESQAEAVNIMRKAGITIVVPEPAVLEATRKKLMTTDDAVIKELKLDPALVAKANAALGVGTGKS